VALWANHDVVQPCDRYVSTAAAGGWLPSSDTKEHAGWFRTALGDLAPIASLFGVRLDPPEIIEVTSTWP
jgi:hypothetical protein